MNTPCNSSLLMVIDIRDQDHFESVNDFICFYRDKVKDYTWQHTLESCWIEIDFFDATDALLFKLKHG